MPAELIDMSATLHALFARREPFSERLLSCCCPALVRVPPHPLASLQATSRLGCGLAQCGGGLGGLVICFYDPPGNVAGQYAAQVQP